MIPPIDLPPVFLRRLRLALLHGTIRDVCRILNDPLGLSSDRGYGYGRCPGEFDPEQVRMGRKVEREHTDSGFVALQIALDHLSEFPNYYDELAEAEKRLEAQKGAKK